MEYWTDWQIFVYCKLTNVSMWNIWNVVAATGWKWALVYLVNNVHLLTGYNGNSNFVVLKISTFARDEHKGNS